MNEKKDNKTFKILTVVLAVALIALSVFTVKFYNEEKEYGQIMENEKADLEKVLQEQIVGYQEAIAENQENKEYLLAAQHRIEILLDSVKGMKMNMVLLSKLRKEISGLQKEKQRLFRMVDSINSQNKLLAEKVDSTSVVLTRQTLISDSLSYQNKNLESKVAVGSKIHVSHIKAEGVKVKNSGKIVTTERSRRANHLKACFTVAKNPLLEAGEKEFYIQIVDPKNNVIGKDQLSKMFGEDLLKYSAASKVYYENDDLDVCVMVEEEDFEEGDYRINIYHKSELLGSTELYLK